MNLSAVRGGGITSRGGIFWAAISTNTNANRNYGYLINASLGNITLTLPAAPEAGDQVAACDAYNMASTNIITIARNGLNIMGSANDLIIDVVGAGFILSYVDATRGWILTDDIQGISWGNINGNITAQSDLAVQLALRPIGNIYNNNFYSM